MKNIHLAINLGADKLNTAAGTSGAGYDTGANLQGTVGEIILVIIQLTGVVLFVLFFYAGFLWMTAQGDEKKVGKAQGIMKNALAGLVILLAAYVISNFIITQLATVA